MKITIQVMSPPYTYEDLDTAIKIAEAGLKKGHEVRIFLFSDAVLAVNTKVKPVRSDRIIPEKLKELIKQGLRVDICGICMDYRGLTADMIIEGANPSGLPELAQLIFTSDIFINLTA
jgi:tRNA 2-thiouridine synthesizing protein D